MAVRKIGKSWWIDFRFRGVRYRKRSPHNTRGGAQQYEAVLRRRLADGDHERVGQRGLVPERFADAAQQWFVTHVETNTKPSVQRGYEMMLRVHLVPRFGARQLESISSYDIEQYKAAKIRSGISAQSVNHQLALLRCFLRTCREWGWIRRMPSIHLMKVPPHRFDFLTPSESERLLRGARGSGWHDMILCALRTGMRAGELRGLRWEDVDLGRGMIRVCRAIVCGQESTPKNNRVRDIPISADLLCALQTREQDSGFVFMGDDGAAVTESAMRRGIEKASREARLRHIGWHVLRHSFASQLASAGAPLPAVQALLGHSSIQMTMRYSHLMSSTLTDTIGLLLPATDDERRKFGQQAVNEGQSQESGGLSKRRFFANVSNIRRDAPNGKAAVC